MAHLRKRTTIVPMAIGFGLWPVAQVPSAFGDLARLQGNSSAALGYHLVALVLTLAAFACFVFALVQVVRHFRGGGDDSGGRTDVRPTLTPVAAQPAFDPDAVMARYLASRPAAPTAPTGFGRKRS